jgi:hypothetical protein
MSMPMSESTSASGVSYSVFFLFYVFQGRNIYVNRVKADKQNIPSASSSTGAGNGAGSLVAPGSFLLLLAGAVGILA